MTERHDVKRDAAAFEVCEEVALYFAGEDDKAGKTEEAAANRVDAATFARWAAFLRNVAPDVPKE